MVFTTPKFLALFVALVLVGAISIDKVNGAGECGRTSPNTMAFKLAPCASAARDANAQVSSQCCSQVETIFTTQSPGCLCAVLLSNMAKLAGIKPEIAISIPQRCNLADRPVGYKCGAYTLP
ncbi:uncharacterized protein LOC144560504 [Carex rostrata]